MEQTASQRDGQDGVEEDRVTRLYREMRRVPRNAAGKLGKEPVPVIADVLERLHPPQALSVLRKFDADRQEEIRKEVAPARRERWEVNERHAPGSIGRLMELPEGVFAPETTVRDAVEQLREVVKRAFITYLYVTDPDGRLVGLVVMREMLLADPDTTLADIMLREPFTLSPETPVEVAMRATVGKHFPVYPVCDEQNRLVGLVRGDDLFEQSVFQLVVQAGSMVGVEREERISTRWSRALRLRHPWLLLNLVTAFVAGGVVSLFEGTINEIVVLAAFLPVLAGQSGNTGCQALAVTLRGISLGDIRERSLSSIVGKEAMLGLLNGGIIGIIAGFVMIAYAKKDDNPDAMLLGVVVWLAMTGSCVASGVTGSLVPIALKKVGADPATASSIFLTTATDVVSMGLMLGLASWLVL